MALVLCLVAARWFLSPLLWCEFGWRIQTPACKKKNKNSQKKPPNPTPESKLRSTQPFSSFWIKAEMSKEPWMVWGDGDKPLCKEAGAAVGPGIHFHPGSSNEWNVFQMLKAFQIFTPCWASCQVLAAPVAPLIRGWCVAVWGSGAGRCTDIFFQIDFCPLGFPTQQN